MGTAGGAGRTHSTYAAWAAHLDAVQQLGDVLRQVCPGGAGLGAGVSPGSHAHLGSHVPGPQLQPDGHPLHSTFIVMPAFRVCACACIGHASSQALACVVRPRLQPPNGL